MGFDTKLGSSIFKKEREKREKNSIQYLNTSFALSVLHYIIQRIQFYEQHKEKQAFPLKMEQRGTFWITNNCMSSGIICEKSNKQIWNEVKNITILKSKITHLPHVGHFP